MPLLKREGEAVALPLHPLSAFTGAEAVDPAWAGITLDSDDAAEAVLGLLPRLKLIAIRFPVFNDGRPFTLARRLRRDGYAGELRAIGHVLPDQYAFLLQCGFDCVEIGKADDPAVWRAALKRLPMSYQNDPAAPDRFAKPSILAARHGGSS